LLDVSRVAGEILLVLDFDLILTMSRSLPFDGCHS